MGSSHDARVLSVTQSWPRELERDQEVIWGRMSEKRGECGEGQRWSSSRGDSVLHQTGMLLHTRIHVHAHTRMHVQTSVHTKASVPTHAHSCTHRHTRMYTHTHTHTYGLLGCANVCVTLVDQRDQRQPWPAALHLLAMTFSCDTATPSPLLPNVSLREANNL